jgi:hypothetical protein
MNVWAGTSNVYGEAQIFTVNTSTWAVTTAGARFEFDTTTIDRNSEVLIDANHVLVIWNGASKADGLAQVLTVNTTTWAISTANSSLNFDTGVIGFPATWKVDTNHFIVFWASSNSVQGEVQILAVNTSTWAVTTAGAILEFDSTADTKNAIYQIDTNHFINFWGGAAGDGFVQVFEVNTSTWAVTTSAVSLEFDTQDSAQNICSQIDSNHFIDFWRDIDGDGIVQVFTVNTSTWEVTTSAATFEFDTQNNLGGSCFKIDTNHFIDFWIGSGTTTNNFAQVFTVELPASGPANLKSYNTNLKANIKSINTNLIANVKSLDTIV